MRRIHLSFFLVAVLTLLVTAGCALPGAGQTAAAPATPPSTAGNYSPAPAGNSQFPDFVSIIARARPSVVAITTESTGFSMFGGAFTQEGAGSGWIIDPNGLVVTNNHVVEGANGITVTLEDGRTFTAQTVHTDPVADLAVVKIKAQSLPALRVGDSSKLQVGQWVIAIGNSLGMGISATKGIVSVLGVSLSTSPGETLHDLIQTDAAINPGNSGGPLLNLQGEVVGINSAKVSQVGVEGMGYAISIREAKPIIDQLITNGYVVRPYLGAQLYTVDQFVAKRYRLAVRQGALVTQVAAGSPAAKAGIKQRDVITSIGSKAVSSSDDVTSIVNAATVGQQAQITYYRGSTKNTVSVTLTQTPPR